MNEVMLYVTNPVTSGVEVIDLYENENISLNKRFTDIATLESQGDFTRQFRVPASDRNLALFGPLFDVNYSGDFSFHKKAEAQLHVSTLEIIVGHIQLIQCVLQAGRIADFVITLYGQTPNLIRAIGTKKLSDIDYTELAHDISFADVSTGGTDWKYALTDRGQKWNENGGGRPVFDTNFNSIKPNEMTLNVRASWLFEKIIADAGFTYSGLTLNNSLNDIWVPFVNANVNQTDILSQNYFFNVGIAVEQTPFYGGTIPTMVEIFDNNNNFTGNQWTAPHDGFFNFRAWCTFNPISFPSSEIVKLQLWDTLSNTVAFSSNPIVVNSTIDQNVQINGTIYCAAGTTINLRLQMSSFLQATGVALRTNINNNPLTGTGWALVDCSPPVAGVPMNIAANAPEYSQKDFVTDIFKMHNLCIVPDAVTPNKLSFIPKSEYFSTGATKDWTAKWDISPDKDTIISPTTDEQKKKWVFTYKVGSDVASKLFEKLGRIYGDYQVTGYTAGLPNDFSKDELKVDLVAASMPSTYIDGTTIVIPKFVNDTEDFEKPGPRFAYMAGTATVAIFNEGTGLGELVTTNLINNYSAVDPTITDDDLNFAPETPLHEITANPYNNLFNRFYRTYLNGIYSDQARTMEAFFALELRDILTFQFNDQIYIKDSWWRVLEIVDYGVGLNMSTKVKLIKILDDIADCAVRPNTVGRNGIISWVDSDGDPATGTQSCCERYGYAWNDDDSTCRTITGAGTNNGSTTGGAIGRIPAPINSDISQDNMNSLVSGANLTYRSGNNNGIVVGDTLDIAADLGPVIVTGRNAVVQFPGVHRGGGFLDSTRTVATGSAQVGSVILSGEGNFMVDPSSIALSSDGSHINIPDNATLSIEVRLSAHRYSTTSGRIIGNHYTTFVALISKTGGLAYVKNQSTLFDTGNFGTLDLIIDTATNTAQHRMSIECSGASFYPIDTVRITAEVMYSQVVTNGNIDIQSFKSLIKETTIMDILIAATPAWEELSDVTVSNAPTRVSYTGTAIPDFYSAVIDAQTAMATANALGVPDYGYVITTAFYDQLSAKWTFIMENMA